MLVVAVIAGAVWWAIGRDGAGEEAVLEASGTIEAMEVDVAAEIGGRVVAVEVEEGDEVAAGDVVVRLDTALLDAQRAQAQLAVDVAKDAVAATAAQARAGAGSINAPAPAASPTGSTARQAAAAEAALAILDVQLDKLTLRAPITGVVLARAIQPGEVALPGAPLLVIGRTDDLTITVYVAEDRYGRIDLGEKAELRVDAFPTQTFDARVVHIDETAQFTPRNVQTAAGRRSTVYGVRLRVDNKRDRLKPGMPADVTFDESSE
ncbi:MAG: efflux RND transporter periplasmic adaptor subunit [Ardenticatenales bacterium]|nr:efflux RND transporter periplasmic adaptor subunit [Ardenticatenales bacterium]